MLLQRCRHREDQQRDDGRDIGFEHAERTDAGDPHHGGRGVADDAAGAAGVGGRDDRGEIADMDFALKYVPGHRAADQCRRDIVEEARQHEHQHQQHKAALPVVRKQRRHLVGHAALLEMPRQQRKPHQQQEQIGQNDPLMLHVQAEAGEAGAGFEAGEGQLVDDDGRKTVSATGSV